ncbi:MinD/ParA family ATP-binding protein [Thermomonospora amylolytica]|nr:MinD/ParA family protein [Thermomonospora amylolytica]
MPSAPPPSAVAPVGDAPGVHPAPVPQQAPAEPQRPQPQPAVPAVPEQQPAGPAAQLAADALVRRRAHGDSAFKRVGRGMRKVVGASAAGDARQQEGMAQRLRSPVPSCRRIAVTSIRGGAGKTTVAALLASVIAEYREDRVLAMDADSGLGSLPLRLGVQPEFSMGQLAAARPRTWEETARFLSPTEHGLWVMSGSARGQVTELELETFQAAASGVGRYFSAAVIDCGAGIVARLQRGVLAAAHAQVFVTPGTVDGAISARQTLSWFVGSGYEDLLRRTVVVLVTHSPHADGDADLERARQVLSDGGMPVEVVPYDRHLATGTAISLDRVSGAARTAAARIAAEAFVRSLSGGAL